MDKCRTINERHSQEGETKEVAALCQKHHPLFASGTTLRGAWVCHCGLETQSPSEHLGSGREHFVHQEGPRRSWAISR